MNVYNQRDYRRRIIVDPSFCVGCAVANTYQAITGEVGEYAKALYEAGKRRQEKHADPRVSAKARSGGISIPFVLNAAHDRFGGEWHDITTIEQVLAWLDAVGPVVAGFTWSEGMEYPTGRGSWFRRWFGPKWMEPNHRAGGPVGRHAVCILGGSHNEGGFFVVENSVGLTWGNKGTARLSWSDLAAMIEGGHVELYGADFPKSV